MEVIVPKLIKHSRHLTLIPINDYHGRLWLQGLQIKYSESLISTIFCHGDI